MKIDKAIVAIDNNPLYDGCWPMVAQGWKNIDNITPVVVAIKKNIPQGDHEIVIPFDPVEGVPDGLVAQVIRFIAPIFFPDDICVLGDIDMVPMSKKYFSNSIKNIPDNALLVMSSDAYEGSEENRFPICYIAAKGRIFQDLIGLKDKNRETIEAFIKELYALELGWSTDELFLGKRIAAFAKDNPVVFLRRNNWDNHEKLKRIDRSKWRINKQMFISNDYIDCHLLRPVSEYKKNVELISMYTRYNNNGLKAYLLYCFYRLKLKLKFTQRP